MRNHLGIKFVECYLNDFPHQVSQTFFIFSHRKFPQSKTFPGPKLSNFFIVFISFLFSKFFFTFFFDSTSVASEVIFGDDFQPPSSLIGCVDLVGVAKDF